ncbi:hypothetical protein E2C01_084437 [Portunus trituberculatus]|uniref:Uncharacterized protein n=1 Tax=Portunus trituberculatus TaxID=210409 RepID=A0A5B7J6A3_PORTR|nr:hypothetical protein [Portunus trituberculatus]
MTLLSHDPETPSTGSGLRVRRKVGEGQE